MFSVVHRTSFTSFNWPVFIAVFDLHLKNKPKKNEVNIKHVHVMRADKRIESAKDVKKFVVLSAHIFISFCFVIELQIKSKKRIIFAGIAITLSPQFNWWFRVKILHLLQLPVLSERSEFVTSFVFWWKMVQSNWKCDNNWRQHNLDFVRVWMWFVLNERGCRSQAKNWREKSTANNYCPQFKDNKRERVE